MNSLAGEKDNQGNFESLDSKTQLPYIISTNQKDPNNYMEERKASEFSEASTKEVKIRKFEDETNASQIVEFSVDLPSKFTNYEHFVGIAESLIEKIEYYISSEGKFLADQSKLGISDSSKRFQSSNAVHFTGALLQSLLKFSCEGKNLVFRFQVPRSQASSLSDQAMKPILSRIKDKSKSAFRSHVLKQDFVIIYKEEFDPSTELNEDEILDELKKIIGSYELILEDSQREQNVSFFHRAEANGELSKLYNAKISANNKEKPGTPSNEADKNKIRAEWLLKEVKTAEKTPQKSQGAFHIPLKTPTDSKAAFGGDVEIIEGNEIEKDASSHNSQEKELQDLLINEYNSSTKQKFLVRLRSFLVAKSPLKISLNSALLLSLVYCLKVNTIKEVKLADLPNFISISKLIPFPVPSALRTLNRWYYITKCIDRIMNVELENCKPRSAYLPATQDFDSESHLKNTISANLCPRLMSFYGWQSVKIASPTADKLVVYESQLNLLNKIFNFFINGPENATKEKGKSPKSSPQATQTSQIESMLKEAKNTSGMAEFAEYECLNDALQKSQQGVVFKPKGLKKPESPSAGNNENQNDNRMDITDARPKIFTVIHDNKRVAKPFQVPRKLGDNSSDDSNKKSPQHEDLKEQQDKISSLENEKKSANKSINDSTNKKNKSPQNKIEKMDIEGDKSDHDMQIEGKKSPFNTDDLSENEPMRRSVTPNKSIIDEKEENKNDAKNISPSKKDTKTKNVEKEYEKSMKELLKKQPIDEARSTLTNLATTKLTPNLKKLREEKITEQIRKTEEWLEAYNREVVQGGKSAAQVKDLIQQISEVPLRVVEMKLLLEQQLQVSRWRVKVDAMLKKLKKPKKKKSNDAANDVTFEDIEWIMKEAEALRISESDDEPKFKELKEKYESIENLLQTLDSSSNELSTLRRAVKEIKNSGIACEQLIEPFKERIELNEKIITMLETNVQIDALDEFTKSVQEKTHLVDPILNKQLLHKNEEGRRLKKLIGKAGAGKDTFDYEQLNAIRTALSSIDTFKLEIPNQSVLTDVLWNFVWLLNLEKLIKNVKRNGSRGNEGFRMNFDVLDKKFDAEEVIRFCTDWVLSAFNPRSVDDNCVAQLRQLLQKGKKYKLYDQRIQTLFNFLNEEVGANSDMMEEELHRKADAIEIEEDSPRERKSRHVVMSLKDWNGLFNQVTSVNIEDFLRKRAEINVKNSSATRAELNDLQEKLQTLLNAYENLSQQSNLKEKVSFLRRYDEWLDWLLTAREWTIETNDKANKAFKHLKELYQRIQQAEIPRSWPIAKMIKEYFSLAEDLLAEYKQKFQHITPFANQPKKRANSKKNNKPTVEEVKSQRALLKKKLYFMNLDQEVGHLTELIGEYTNWKVGLDAYIKNNSQRVMKAAITPLSKLNDYREIEIQLNQLKSDYDNLCLRDEEDEKTLTGLECQLKNYLLVKNDGRPADVKEMQKLVRRAEETTSTQNTALRRLKAEINNGQEHQYTIKELRRLTQRPEDPLTLQDVKQLQYNLKKSSIKSVDDVQFLEDLIQKGERLRTQGRQLCNPGKKKPLVEFKSILDQLRHQIICFPEEEKLLEDTIAAANKMAKYIKENPKLSPSATEKFLYEYRGTPVAVTEAEKLIDRYEKSKVNYERLKVRINELEKAKSIDYDQLKNVANSLDDIHFDFEGNLTYMQAQVYSLRIRHLQSLTGTQDGISPNKGSAEKDYDFEEEFMRKSVILSAQTIKAMAREGHDLKKDLLEQKRGAGVINQAIFWIDNICKRIDEKIKEINAVSSLDVLDKMPKLLLGFIDLSQNFIERKAAITSGTGTNGQKSTPQASGYSEAKTKSSTGRKKGFPDEKEELSTKSTMVNTPEVGSRSKSSQKQLKDFFGDKRAGIEEERDQQKDEASKSPNQKTLNQYFMKNSMDKNEKQMQSNLEMDKSPRQISSPLMSNSQKASPMSHGLTLTICNDSSIKVDPKKSKAIPRIRDLLQNNSIDPSFDGIKANNTAYRIVSAFPSLDQSKELFETFEVFFKELLRLPNVFRMLVKKSFPAQQIATLFTKSSNDLIALDKVLDKDKDRDRQEKPASEPETQEGELATKKVKVSQSKSIVNEPKEVKNPIANFMNLEASPAKLPENSKLRELMADTAHSAAKMKSSLQSKGGIEVSPLRGSNFNLSPFSHKSAPRSAQKGSIVKMPDDFEEEKFSDHGNEEAGVIGQPIGMDFEDLPHEQPGKSSAEKIPYDPDEDSEDEYERQNKLNQVSQIIKENIFTKVPHGSVLRIFNGILREGEEEATPPVGLYTCDPIQVVRSMPQILADRHGGLILEGKMACSKFEPYINKYANTFDKKKIELISGWVEALNPAHQQVFEKIANCFLADQKVGVAKYLECSKIFFLHKNQFRPEWVERFKFRQKNLHSDINSSLYFLFTFQPDKFSFDLSLLKRLEPEVVAPQRDRKGDRWKNRKNYKENDRKPSAQKTGTSTPDIEFCPDSQDGTEHFRGPMNDRRNMNARDSRSPMGRENPRKNMGYSPSTNFQVDFGKMSPFKFPFDDNMEVEKAPEEKKSPLIIQSMPALPTTNTVNQPSQEQVILDPRLRRGLKDFPKSDKSSAQNKNTMDIENKPTNTQALGSDVQNNDAKPENKTEGLEGEQQTVNEPAQQQQGDSNENNQSNELKPESKPYDPESIQNEETKDDLESDKVLTQTLDQIFEENNQFTDFGAQNQEFEAEYNPNDQQFQNPEYFDDGQQEQWQPEVDGQGYAQEEPYYDDQQNYQDPSNNKPFRQFNQPRYSGNYRGGNQNYRSPNKGRFDNRNNYQKPFYNSYGNTNDGSNYQRNRYHNDNYRNNQTPRRYTNQRFDMPQTPSRSQGYSNRPQQNFGGPRRYGNNYRRFPNNQNTEYYADQQGNEASNVDYEAGGELYNQNESGYSGYKGPRANVGTNVQQGYNPKKVNTEESIFGKARMNLSNASYGKGNNSDL